jgi:hypothetical protein
MDNVGVVESLKTQAGGLAMSESWVKVAIIIGLVFLLLLVVAKMTRGYMSWYTNFWWLWTGLGFLLAIVVEGFFLLSGGTVFTSVLGWEGAPKPIQAVLSQGRERLKEVLEENAPTPTTESVLDEYELLDEASSAKVQAQICTPPEESEE